MSIAKGQIVEGVVTGITKFGAFIELPGGVTGLVHISEVADSYVKDVNDFLKEQDKVKVKVINIDNNGKIGLSIRQAKTKPDISFEEKLTKFLKDSDERIASLNKNINSKRKSGNRY
ncbi:MAG: binding domain protein [Clostridia bacterium]|nr:binding domain protein [Clostridia bacterium]MDN5321660.1 binding domain protein [Clostridia bacterium]